MKTQRNIIEIDEELCDGCGQCIISCAEGALEIIDGKARLVGEVYCDGLGACLGDCPQGALTIVEREADGFDEDAVEERLKTLKSEEAPSPQPLACGCPGSETRTLEPPCAEQNAEGAGQPSALRQWPVKLQLLGPGAPYLRDADLCLLADCAAAAYANLHRDILPGYVVAMGCPKLDDLEAHVERLALLVKEGGIRSLTVLHMEVPCCMGFVWAAEQAVKRSGRDIPVHRRKISVSGEVLEEVEVPV